LCINNYNMPSKTVRRYRGRGTKYVTGGRRRRTMAGRRRIHRGRGVIRDRVLPFFKHILHRIY